MAKTNGSTSIESTLWEAANKLRSEMADDKEQRCPLIFMNPQVRWGISCRSRASVASLSASVDRHLLASRVVAFVCMRNPTVCDLAEVESRLYWRSMRSRELF